MPASAWKTRANRTNAEKSTGPTTDEGKERSRANAMTHGLSGNGTVLARVEAERIAERLELWRPDYRIDSAVEEWAFEQVVVNSVRMDACRAHEFSTREYEQMRAREVWEIDQEAEVALLGDRLARKPEVVLKQLLQSKYGCLWMIERWSELGGVLEAGKAWNDGQVQQALDLLGAPRDARTKSDIDDPQWVVERQSARLQALLANHLDGLDGLARRAAESGHPTGSSKAVSTIRRYEAACLKRLKEALNMLQPSGGEAVEVTPSRPAVLVVPDVPEPEDAAVDEPSTCLASVLDAIEEKAVLTSSPRLTDALPKPADQAANRPLNRKQRKALARKAAASKLS